MERGIVCRAPVRDIAVYGIRIHAGDNVFGHVAQFFDIEQRARTAHLLGREREVVHRRVRIGAPPLLKVGI